MSVGTSSWIAVDRMDRADRFWIAGIARGSRGSLLDRDRVDCGSRANQGLGQGQGLGALSASDLRLT
eukprot:scaffold494_cov117-Isochrysis_galbana.AAC.17